MKKKRINKNRQMIDVIEALAAVSELYYNRLTDRTFIL